MNRQDAPSGPQQQSEASVPLSPAVKLAATRLAIWGPCRGSGDDYLACVALKGKGECQSLRHLYEGCMQANVRETFEVLAQMGEAMCTDEQDQSERLERAANRILRQSSSAEPGF